MFRVTWALLSYEPYLYIWLSHSSQKLSAVVMSERSPLSKSFWTWNRMTDRHRERDSSNSKWHDSARQATNRHRSAAGDKKGRKIRYLTVQQGKRFRQVSTLILETWFLRNSDFWGCHCNRSRLYEFDPNIPIQAWNFVKNLTPNLKYNL